MARTLTPKQERFVAEYLVDLNATQAAIRAGYSERTAGSQGERLLKNVEIVQAIEAARAKLAARLERTAVDVLRDIQAVTLDARAAGDNKSALRGLELEGRHLGMFDDRLRVTAEAKIVVIREQAAPNA